MKYNTVVIDFPWPISLTGKQKTRPNRREKLPYKTMSVEEIEEFPLNEFANNGTHVYIWSTNKTLPDTFKILESLGVHYHLVLPWVKPSGITPCFAYKFASEFLILGFYGRPMQPFTGKGKLNWIRAPPKRDGHSTKPDEMYELIKEMSPSPRIDLFARKRHDGFDAWGDQAEKENPINP